MEDNGWETYQRNRLLLSLFLKSKRNAILIQHENYKFVAFPSSNTSCIDRYNALNQHQIPVQNTPKA